MAEENNAGEAAAAAQQQQSPKMKVLAQYVRDLSFENIMVQNGVEGDVQPEIEVSVALDARKRAQDNQYEVIQKYKITSKAKGGDQKLFLLELEYGGIFEVTNVPEDQVHPYALIECPRMLFPYVRRIVGDITRDGGFPQLNLEGVDFVALYRQELQRRAQAQSANETPV